MDDSLEFELNDGERRHLRTMLKSPGYRVLRKIQQSYIDAMRETAVAMSENDPLANLERVGQLWAYVSVAKQFAAQAQAGVDFELALLDKSEKPARDPQELARRRRQHAMSGSLTPFSE